MKDSKKEILKKIQPIFWEVFGNKKLKIDYNSSANTIKQWDSLAQINLIVGVERIINIKFNVSELANIKNVGEIIDLIIAKKN